MRNALHAIYWEILYKNRLVLPTIAVLLGVGGATAWAIQSAGPQANWVTSAQRLIIVSFLVSLLVGLAPFTLTESTGGWRMNSMVTRWFALPLCTNWMVFLPLLCGCVWIAILVGLWAIILHFIAPGLDALHVAAVLMTTLIAMMTVAWTVPRKPVQYWTAIAIIFPVALILAFGPQDRPGQEAFRRGMLIPLSYAGLFMLAFARYAAGRNRCGAWPGEIPFHLLGRLFRTHGRAATTSRIRHQSLALFRLESIPLLRLLAFGWSALLLVLYVWVSFSIRRSHPEIAFTWRVFPMVGVGLLPVLAIPCVTLWALFGSGEPSSPFRTRLTSFRATLPMTSGAMAAQKILMLLLGWIIIWTPLVLFSLGYTPAVLGIETEDRTVMQQVIVKFMGISAFLLIGALPFCLWARVEGFPNILLANICSWALAWAVCANLKVLPGEAPGKLWILATALLTAKFLLAGTGFVRAVQLGHTTWRYPAIVLLAWLVVVGLLLLPFRNSGPTLLWTAVVTMALIPLARIAWCPLAIAANRHR